MNIAILGSTGSIGTSTLDVVRGNRDRFHVHGLTAHSNVKLLAQQIAEFQPELAIVTDRDAFDSAQGGDFGNTRLLFGDEAVLRLAEDPAVDTVVGAMVGFAGLRSAIKALQAGKRLALANKETLVVAGELMTALAAKSGAAIYPIDSEHSAIAQCLVGEPQRSIKRILLTASGGPFRTRPKETFESISLAEALRHPNWVMGQKITIDSATLMNKGLEVIEARWLFGLEMDQVDVIVHPQSIVHSMVEFVDGSVKAQLGAPDMRLPIQYALSAPERLPVAYDLLDLLKANRFDFEAPDTEKFPALCLAREAGKAGGLMPCVLNAANEVAVAAFLNQRIGFTMIPTLIEDTMSHFERNSKQGLWSGDPETILEEIERCDRAARDFTQSLLERRLETVT